jgi:hypothetical protein
MDINHEIMIQALMKEDASVAADEDEHLKIISYLLCLRAEQNATPKHGD